MAIGRRGSKRQANVEGSPHVTTGMLRIFVYGTLKRGMCNHDHFCRRAVSIQDAVVRGQLYELPSGIPVLQVHDSDVLAVGTLDPLVDVATQERFSTELTVAVAPDEERWQMIHGELMVLADPRSSLPPVDRLEGFRPGTSSLYRRVLIPVSLADDEQALAWCYVAGESVVRSMVPTGKICWP